jgi:hypothetical protein
MDKNSIVFVTLVGSPEEDEGARLLIASLRAFGGRLSRSSFWVLAMDPEGVSRTCHGLPDVTSLPLERDAAFPRYPFAAKVNACAQAERMAGRDGCTLVWLNALGLIVNPPLAFDLAPPHAVAFRPVHIRNVGSLAAEPLDAYWAAVYRTVGLADTSQSLESFIGAERLRPYFNTHLFAFDPSLGLMAAWRDLFLQMLADSAFQDASCRDELHRIFLHQATLSALLTRRLEWDRLRFLPPEYSYPLHLHHRIPSDRRPATLNELVCPVFEEPFRYPGALNGLAVREPLLSWLVAQGVGSEPA